MEDQEYGGDGGDGGHKQSVEVGSGDFQSNPIYGDEPESYKPSLDSNNIAINNNDDDENNPFANQQQPPPTQEQQQQYGQEQQTYGNDGGAPQQNNVPPPYQEQQQQQGPPPAYSQQDPNPQTYGQDEPEDVVAALGQDEDVGDYGITQPKTEEDSEDTENGEGLFGNFFIRTVTIAASLFFTSMMGMAMWLQSSKGNILLLFDEFKTAFGLSGFAIFIIFLASILALVYAIMQKLGRPIPFENIFLWTTIGSYAVGGLFYFIGGCAVAYAYNEFKLSYIAGIFFAEQSFVGFHAILAGVDLWKKEILNDKKKRVIIYNVLFFLVALVCFFAYAVTSTEIDDAGGDNAGAAWLALFYFLVMIPQVLFMIIYIIPKLSETLGKAIVYLILAAAFGVCVVCILIGYFIITGQFDGIKGRAYFLGVGVFIFVTGSIIAFDMLFDRFIPGYKDGGNSVSDQQAQGVPTTNPDSE